MEAASPPPPPPPPPPPAPPPPPSNFGGQHRQLSFQEAVSDGFSKYVEFNGRSSRSAFWWWVLFAFLVGIVANILDAILGTSPLFSLVVGLGLLLPGLAVTVRRLHDTGRSGWWWFIQLIPIAGFIIMLVFLLTESKPPNKWGAGPDQLPDPVL